MIEKWQGIEQHKKQVTPNFNTAKYIRGNRIPKGKRAEATAEYLEKCNDKQGQDFQKERLIRAR